MSGWWDVCRYHGKRRLNCTVLYLRSKITSSVTVHATVRSYPLSFFFLDHIFISETFVKCRDTCRWGITGLCTYAKVIATATVSTTACTHPCRHIPAHTQKVLFLILGFATNTYIVENELHFVDDITIVGSSSLVAPYVSPGNSWNRNAVLSSTYLPMDLSACSTYGSVFHVKSRFK